MKSSFSFAALLLAPVVLLAAGCFATDPCGPGLKLNEGGTCSAIPAPAAVATTDAGASSSDGDAAAATSFGKTCTAMTDCSGDAPICAAPQLPYCTQISCQPGEANAGACPSGWTCTTTPQGSACLKN